MLTLCIVSPIKPTLQEQTPFYIMQLKWCTLPLLLKRDCILWVFQIMLNLTLLLVKVCNLLIKPLLNISFLGERGNLITTNFVSSNNHFSIDNSSFSLLNLKKSKLNINAMLLLVNYIEPKQIAIRN